MSQILGVKFSDYGPVCYFASGALVVRAGQSVLVETDQGLALGRVTTVAAPEAAASETPAAAIVTAAPAPFEASLSLPGWDEAEPEAAPFEALASEGTASEGAGWELAVADAVESPEAEEPQQQPGAAAALFSSDQATQAQPRPRSSHGLQRVYRLATPADLESHAENRRVARRAFLFCRGSISSLNLDMKLVDVEVLHDRSKMIFFFTAPNRIDFRELIKSLVREFHTRIELRQIGVRHETQMIGAIGNCGQVCCCRRFLRKFAPVTIKMAKEQNLFLNPAKISGICGRLLCCLSYEQKGYEEFHKQCPKIGKRVQTPIGSAKVLRANFFKKSISVWLEDMGEREYTLEEWKELLNRQPGEAPPAEAQPGQPGGGAQAQGRGAQARGGSRPSTGRPARPDRSARPERPDRPERPERPDRPPRAERSERPDSPEAQSAPAALAEPSGQPDAPKGEAPAAPNSADGADRPKPRRRRRKGRGPRPAG